MVKRILVGVVFTLGPLLLVGCWETNPPKPDEGSVGSELMLEQLRPELLEIARTYEGFGRVDPRQLLWAPRYCQPPDSRPNTPALSASGDAETHGRKLYSLFVNMWPEDAEPLGSYTSKTASPVGQVIVKESWVPEVVTDPEAKREPVVKKVKRTRTAADGSTEPYEVKDQFLPYAEKDGKWYRAAERGPLFVMMKLDPSTPGTDRGWVYGVVSPDGKEVQAVGRITSCMNCHEKAPHDRLFGPPKE